MYNFDYYIGIDPSITSTAVTVMTPDKKFIKSFFLSEKKKFLVVPYNSFHSFVCPTNWRKYGHDFYLNYVTNAIVSVMEEYVDRFNCKITLEGYSYSSKGLTFSIGEFVGLLKHKIRIIRNWTYQEVPPATVKKYILKGNSNKVDLMYTFLTKQIHTIREVNPDWCDELQKFVSDSNFAFNLSKVESPLSDVLDSIYIAMWSIEDDNENNV